jgi:dephospho-CoA kinase
MTKIIGITGGIGSGKTTVCDYLKKNNFAVHESDKVVAQMYKNPSKSFLHFLKKNISKEVVKNNKINKQKITDIIFNNPKTRRILEGHVHKQVKKSRDSFVKKNAKNKKGVMFIDIPLLFENKLEKTLDVVLCVIAKKKIRRERVLKNKKFKKNIVEKIFKSQISDVERKKKSNIFIYNNTTKKDFIFSLEKALIGLLK